MATPVQVHTDFSLSAHVVREQSELQSLASDWKNLFHTAECDNVFLSFEWLSQWSAHFGGNCRLFVIAIRESSGNMVAVAPLYISKAWGPLSLRRLGLLGDRFVGSDHLGLLVTKAYMSEALESIYKCIFEHQNEWDFIEFASASPDSTALSQLQNRLLDAGKMKTHRTASSVCPYFQLPHTTEEYWSSLRPKLRKNLRYQTRTLEREGQLNFVAIEDPSEMTGAFEDLLRLHQLRSERRGRHSTFLDAKLTSFHRAALQGMSKEGAARIFFFELSGKRIAALYGFSAGRKFCYYQSGADPTYSRFGVGTLLISAVIEWAIRNGHTEFDFLRGDEPYKQLWATGSTQLQDVSFFDSRLKSRFAQSLRITKNSLREWKSALRQRTQSSSDRSTPVATTAL